MSQTHLTDDQLVAALDRELSSADLVRVDDHLAACWTCRTRSEELATAMTVFVQARDSVLFARIPPPPDWPRLKPQLVQLDARATSVHGFWTRVSDLLGLCTLTMKRWRAAAVGAAVFTVVVGAVLSLYERPLAAAEVLARTRPVDAVDGRRQLTIEERDAPTGRLRGRRRVDVWQNTARRVTARRLFDEQGRLVAGEWTSAEGTRTVLIRGQRPSIEPAGTPLPVTPADAWRLSPAATTFGVVTSTADAARTPVLTERDDSYVVSAPIRDTTDATIALTVRKADMYPVAHTLTLGTTIVSIVEIAFDETPASSMPPAVFELDGELLGAHVADAAVPPVKPVSRAPRLSDTDATALALDALLQLDRVGALLGERISITRSPGSLAIEARTDTSSRRDELRAALAPVAARPGTSVDVRTFADASSDAATGSPPTVKVIELTGTRGPLYDDLRGFFLAKADASDPDAAAIDARIQQFTRTAIDRARRARQHARAVVQLTMHMPESALEMVDRARARAWWTAVAGHLRIVEDETQALRADLEPVFHGEALASADAEGRPSAGIQADAARLLEMAAANDTEIGRAFSRALQATDAPIAVRSTAFRDALRATERLASSIRTAALPAR